LSRRRGSKRNCMAWTSSDLTAIETAIRALITGTRSVQLTMGDKSIAYTAVDLPTLRAMRDEIKTEVGAAAGTCSPRTYAKQGGRAI
jgi:hypothetical protein